MKESRTVYLLGAGASRLAVIPLASEMTLRAVEKLNADRRPRMSEAVVQNGFDEATETLRRILVAQLPNAERYAPAARYRKTATVTGRGRER